jgi:hypothetical protein
MLLRLVHGDDMYADTCRGRDDFRHHCTFSTQEGSFSAREDKIMSELLQFSRRQMGELLQFSRRQKSVLLQYTRRQMSAHLDKRREAVIAEAQRLCIHIHGLLQMVKECDRGLTLHLSATAQHSTVWATQLTLHCTESQVR